MQEYTGNAPPCGAAQAGRAGTPGVAVATARRSALTGVDPATYTDAVPLTYRAVGDA